MLALVICTGAFLVAVRSWRVVGTESHGHMETEVGEGRTRFLGIIGMAFSVRFFCAVLFGLISLWIVQLCVS